VGVQEVRWYKGDSEPANAYTFLYGNENANHHLGTGFFVHKRTASLVKRVEFVCDGTSYVILRSRWCDIIDLNVQAPTEDKCHDTKNRFHKEPVRVFNQFSKYDMKIVSEISVQWWGGKIHSN
jgi:hypothetical protein